MSPRTVNVCRRALAAALPWLTAGIGWSATLTLQPTPLGDTPALLAYNSGHFVPGSNTRDWWRYSRVTGARLFLTPGLIEAQDDLPGWGDGVVDRAAFLARRAALRADPLNPAFINWNYLTNRFGLTAQHGSNLLEPFHTCATLRALGIALLVNLTADPGTFPITGPDDWAGKWELWQHYYFEAFFLGREFDVERFQMWNEPDASSGPALADYLERLKLVSDAVQCALADVNRLYGKTLSPRILAPVTAGNASSDYTGWGRPIVTNRHVNFLGETDPAFQLIHQYDYHEYNPPVSTFASHLQALHGWLAADMAPEARWPTSISEFNAHTAAVFASMPDTLDTPSKFTRLGAIAATLAANDCRELYCFKFSQTLYNSTVPVKKNGTHFVDNTNAPYNIGGITRGGEVWRLFNKAAAPGRQRLAVQTGGAPGVFLATRDPRSETHWLFSANDTADVALQLDATRLGLPPGQRVLLEEIGEERAGVRALLSVVSNRVAAGTQALNSVWLFTLPSPPQAPSLTLPAAEDATVQDGAARSANFGATNRCWVRNHSSDPGRRAAALDGTVTAAEWLADLRAVRLRTGHARRRPGRVGAQRRHQRRDRSREPPGGWPGCGAGPQAGLGRRPDEPAPDAGHESDAGGRVFFIRAARGRAGPEFHGRGHARRLHHRHGHKLRHESQHPHQRGGPVSTRRVEIHRHDLRRVGEHALSNRRDDFCRGPVSLPKRQHH